MNEKLAEEAMKSDKNIRMLYIETPANPTIQCVDIEALITLAKKYGILVACDNTFARRSVRRGSLSRKARHT